MRKKTFTVLKIFKLFIGITLISCAMAFYIFSIHSILTSMKKCQNEEIQNEYIDAANIFNNVSFDSLNKDDGILLNGMHVKFGSTITYPDDRIVYYKNIILSVENNNGLAKVVTAFDEYGNEISMP